MLKRMLVLALVASAVAAEHPWVDVSVLVDPATTPVYAGDPPIVFTEPLSLARGDIATVSKLEMGAHTGTHVDAPAHFIPGGKGIDGIPLEKMVGPCRVLECTPGKAAVDAAELNRLAWKGVKRVLFKTKSSYENFYADAKFHTDFGYVAPDAARLLAEGGVELVGVDYQSLEQFGAKAPEAHRILLGKEVVVVEGLDLRQIKGGDYDLMCLPVRLKERDGAPARVLLRKR